MDPRAKAKYSRNTCLVQQNVVPVPYPPGALSMASGSAASERPGALTRAGTENDGGRSRKSDEKPPAAKTATAGGKSGTKRAPKTGDS